MLILPDKRLIISTMYKQLIRRQLKRESLGEELRVLYVALTRAKEKLIITGTIGKICETSEQTGRVVWRCRQYHFFPWESEAERQDTYWAYILPALART